MFIRLLLMAISSFVPIGNASVPRCIGYRNWTTFCARCKDPSGTCSRLMTWSRFTWSGSRWISARNRAGMRCLCAIGLSFIDCSVIGWLSGKLFCRILTRFSYRSAGRIRSWRAGIISDNPPKCECYPLPLKQMPLLVTFSVLFKILFHWYAVLMFYPCKTYTLMLSVFHHRT